MVALLILLQVLMELNLGLFFWIFGFRFFRLARRVVQQMGRKSIFELSKRSLHIIFRDFNLSSFASSASILCCRHIIFGKNLVLGVKRAEESDQVYDIWRMALVHAKGPPIAFFG